MASYLPLTPLPRKSRPWTQVPGIRFLKNILNRIGVLVRLYVKVTVSARSLRATLTPRRLWRLIGEPLCMPSFLVLSILRHIVRAFTRFSHSTAFLPLAVTALGMAARLCILSLEFCDAAQSMWKDIHQLLAELEVSICFVFLIRFTLHHFSHTIKPVDAN